MTPSNNTRVTLLKTLTILTPFVILALVEVLLRVFGFGHDLRLFVRDKNNRTHLVMNQHVSERYFADQKNATIGNFEPFAEHKPENTFRIFVLGESTTIGYPYMHNGSFHRWLQYRLMHSFPEKDFEVINLSLTAVNSHTVLDFAKTIVDYQPDVVLVYTGHNEYYGAMGAADAGALHYNPLLQLVMKAREFRLVQLMSMGVSKLRELFSGNAIDVRENLMKRMAGDQQVTLHSAKYKRGVEQFRDNMHAMCALLQKHNIPLLLSTLVSNEKDLKPLVSLPGGTKVSADLHYKLAGELYQAGKFSEAKNEFVLASELDVLRFRAPQAMNAIIREVAGQYRNITLVDSRAAFEKHSAHGILGKETLLEHVHPNLTGYALLAESFYNALNKSALIGKPAQEMSFKEWQRNMPVTKVDSLKGEYEIMILKEGWPFNVPIPAEKREKTLEEQLAGALVVKQIKWADAMYEFQKSLILQNDTAGALRVAEAMVLENPLDVAGYDKAARLCLMASDNRRAVNYLTRAFRMENSFERARLLFAALLKMDKPREALSYITYAAAHNVSQFNFREMQQFVAQLALAKENYEKDSTNVSLSNQLAAGHLKFANAHAAQKYLHKSLQIEPGNAAALQMEAQLRLIPK